jgi:hypothetical protein
VYNMALANREAVPAVRRKDLGTTQVYTAVNFVIMGYGVNGGQDD